MGDWEDIRRLWSGQKIVAAVERWDGTVTAITIKVIDKDSPNLEGH